MTANTQNEMRRARSGNRSRPARSAGEAKRAVRLALATKKGQAADVDETGSPPGTSTRTGILDAAASIIVEQGYEACTMRTLAARMSIKASSLYYHFASKDELIEEVINLGIEELYDRIVAAIGAMPDEAPFATRLEAAVFTHLMGMAGENKKLQVYEHLPPHLRRRSGRIRSKYAKLWVDLLSVGVARGDIDPDLDLKSLVIFFLGGLNRVPVWLKASGRTGAEISQLALRVLMRGIGTRRDERAKR